MYVSTAFYIICNKKDFYFNHKLGKTFLLIKQFYRLFIFQNNFFLLWSSQNSKIFKTPMLKYTNIQISFSLESTSCRQVLQTERKSVEKEEWPSIGPAIDISGRSVSHLTWLRSDSRFLSVCLEVKWSDLRSLLKEVHQYKLFVFHIYSNLYFKDFELI